MTSPRTSPPQHTWLRISLIGALAVVLGACSQAAPAVDSSAPPLGSAPNGPAKLQEVDGKSASGKLSASNPGRSGNLSGTVPPTTETPPVATAPATPPATPRPSGTGLSVDESRIPAAATGFDSHRIGPASYSRTAGDGSAAFRTNCSFSHMNFDDPIVFPGQARAAHLHIFFGNTSANAASTPASIRTSGNSTCTGGTANRSAYWAPAIIDTATGAPIGAPTAQVDRDHFLQVYYKTGYDGVRPGTVQNFPPGLRMIAGNSRSTSPQDRRIGFSCTGSGGPEISRHTSFPACAPGQLFIMGIDFPQCWDGVNLDSPNHQSHMAYGAGWPDKGCPSSHPVPLAQITQNFRYRVPAGGMSTWRLSSDMYNGPAGYSAHADWMNGWDTAVFQRVVDNCYRGGFDCAMNLLGDGQALR